ncbi:MAG TPA: GGDEF domain-containing protein [Vicinamibacterales bacterium]|nr:GGDEF domain-containing protein [Vicinamibacterales bacterium]
MALRAAPEHPLRTLDQLRDWLERALPLEPERRRRLLAAVEEVVSWQRQLVERARDEAIQALSEAFAARVGELRRQLDEKETTVAAIARHFEEVVAELSERAHRDPKTRLLNFDWFMERLGTFLGAEQRGRWCAVGVVDIHRFKRYNDTLGHAVGDRIIERVARILAEQIRTEDLLALERPGRDLHARFGGDEFCFFIPDLPGVRDAVRVAERFRRAVCRHDWGQEDPRLIAQPVSVDVGIVCLRLGPVAERRGAGRRLAGELVQLADRLMYLAKRERSERIHAARVHVRGGALVEGDEEARGDGLGPIGEPSSPV